MPKIDTSALINTAITNLPGIIALIRGDHAARHPDAPLLTDEQVQAALLSAVGSSLAKDDDWLRLHPQG